MSINCYKFFKRLFDFIFSSIIFLIISPVFILTILILKFTAEKEVFYLQERLGLDRKVFYIFKFSTMLKNSLNSGNKTVTLRNDPRITGFGKILRYTKINELPQLINVIKGDMSIVGPRPLLIKSFEKYSLDVQRTISKIKPGVTGIGSVIFRDEESLVSAYAKLGRNPLEYYKKYIYPYKGSLEMWYSKNQSLKTDFKIILLTIYSIFFSESNLVFRIFQDLPKKPNYLTKEGILTL